MMRLIQTVLACVLAVAATAKKQPNILFVVVDDFGTWPLLHLGSPRSQC